MKERCYPYCKAACCDRPLGLALVALVYSVVPITYGISGAPLEFFATGLVLLVIGLALITRLAPGRPMLRLGVLLLV